VHRNGVSGGAFGNARGSVNFGGGAAFATSSALEDFFAGLPTNGSVLSGDPRRHLSDWSYAAFLQDDMRVSPTFTLNLGLRYELNTALKEEHDLIANFDPNAGLVQVGKQIKAPFQTNHANFAPRAGFAWDIGGQGKTGFAAAGGIMYENVNWQAYLALTIALVSPVFRPALKLTARLVLAPFKSAIFPSVRRLQPGIQVPFSPVRSTLL